MENIDLGNGLIWDCKLPFCEQTNEVRAFISQCMTEQPVYEWDDTNRPSIAGWDLMKFRIKAVAIYNTEPPSCGVDRIDVTVTGNEIWHELDKTIQIILTLQQQVDLLSAYPEFATYTSEAGLPTHVEGNVLYTYDNTFCREYRSLVNFFGGQINEKLR